MSSTYDTPQYFKEYAETAKCLEHPSYVTTKEREIMADLAFVFEEFDNKSVTLDCFAKWAGFQNYLDLLRYDRHGFLQSDLEYALSEFNAMRDAKLLAKRFVAVLQRIRELDNVEI